MEAELVRKPKKRARNRERAESLLNDQLQNLVDRTAGLPVVRDEPSDEAVEAVEDTPTTSKDAVSSAEEVIDDEPVPNIQIAEAARVPEHDASTSNIEENTMATSEEAVDDELVPVSVQENSQLAVTEETGGINEEKPPPIPMHVGQDAIYISPQSRISTALSRTSTSQLELPYAEMEDMPPPLPQPEEKDCQEEPKVPKTVPPMMLASCKEDVHMAVIQPMISYPALPNYVDATTLPREAISDDVPVPVYPQTASAPMFEMDEADTSCRSEALGERLLSVEQLRTFYLNERLEIVDELIAGFVQNEIQPVETDPFFELVSRYCDAERQLEARTSDLAQMEVDCSRMQKRLWVTNRKNVKQTGECLCKRSATGTADIETSEYQKNNVAALRKALDDWRKMALQHRAVLACMCQSLEMQCTWLLQSYIDEFMQANGVHTHDPDVKIIFSAPPSVRDQVTRYRIRYCITVLFYHLRVPNLTQAFIDDVKKWILKLCATLLRSCTEFDQLFMTSHVLRCGLAISDWAVRMIRPITSATLSDTRSIRDQIDHFVVIIYLLTVPVSKREEFLAKCLHAASADNNWTELDDDGEDMSSHLHALRDEDLVALLGQCSFEHLYAGVFNIWRDRDEVKRSHVLSVFAFQLTCMKLMYDGIQTYNRSHYAQFCKRLAHVLRQSVRYVSEFWSDCCQRSPDLRENLQPEYDRLMLFFVHAIVSAPELGVWQFLVDIPCANTSEACRDRIRALLRCPTTYRFSVLCGMSTAELEVMLKDDSLLVNRVRDLTDTNALCLLSSLCHIAVQGKTESAVLECLRQVMQVCFVEPETRSHTAKVGAECIGRLVDEFGQPAFSHALKLMDRNAENMLQYLTIVLSQTRLSKCRPLESDLHLIGKWVVNRAPDHELNNAARRLLIGLNWSPNYANVPHDLYLPSKLHTLAAQIIQSAHRQHCTQQNGLLLASVKKASKLALRIPDMQQQFDGFCWQVLLRLKLPVNVEDVTDVVDDTANYFVHLITQCCHDASLMESTGVRLLTGLLDAGSFGAAITVLAHTVYTLHSQLPNLIKSPRFAACVDRCVHADQSTLASLYTCITGDSSLPVDTKYLALLQRTLTSDSEVFNEVALGWLHVLMGSRADWHTDTSVLCLLDVLVQRCFMLKSDVIKLMRPIIAAAYQVILEAHRTAGRGMLNWISGAEPMAPSLIASAQMSVCPWFAYLGIQVEAEAWKSVQDKLVQVMLKHPNLGLEQALKKTVTKLAMSFAIERLCFYRWLDLIGCLATEHSLLPLACQQLAIHMLIRVNTPPPENKITCIGQRLLRARCTESKFNSTKAALEKACHHWKAQKGTSGGDPLMLADLYSAILSWLWDSRLYNPDERTPATTPLDYLLHLIISDDREPWLNYVNMTVIQVKHDRLLCCLQSLYQTQPVLTRSMTSMNNMEKESALTTLTDRASRTDVALGVQSIVTDSPLCLHPAPRFDANLLVDASRLIQEVTPKINALVNSSNKYMSIDDHISLVDNQLTELTPKLYNSVNVQVPVSLRCSSTLIHSCNNPRIINAVVEVMRFSTSVENEIGENRNSRRQELIAFETELLNHAPMNVAYLEMLCRHLSVLAPNVCSSPAASEAGITLFYHLITSITTVTRTFPLTNSVFSQVLDIIGQRYLMNVVSSQEHLLDVILQRPEISDLLLTNFSPNCLPPSQFISVYSRILTAFRAKRTDALIVSLCTKMDVSVVFPRFPPPDAFILIPMILQMCAAAQHRDCEQLQVLGIDQFVHASLARYPAFITESIRLYLHGIVLEQQPPVDILARLNASLVDCATDGSKLPKYPINGHLAASTLAVCASAFGEARSRLGVRMFSHLATYTTELCTLVSLLYSRLLAECDLQQHTSVIESDVQRLFVTMTSVFGPWLEPTGGVQLPWSIDNNQSAVNLLNTFVNCLQQTHQRYKQVTLHGENLMCHFLLYYSQRYTSLKRASAHCHQLYNTHFVQLPWNTLYPSLPAVDAIRKGLCEGAEECRPLIVNVVVRVPWTTVCQMQCQQPVDASKVFHSMLLEIVCRAVIKPEYYVDCRASLPQLIEQLLSCDWWLMEPSALHQLAVTVKSTYDVRCLIDEDTPQSTALRLLRCACELQRPMPSLSARSGQPVDAAVVLSKQVVYVDCVVQMLVTNVNASGLTSTQRLEYMQAYCRLAVIVDDVITQMMDTNMSTPSDVYSVTRSLLQLWLKLNRSDDNSNTFDQCLSDFCTWLLDNPDRQLVLLLTHHVVVPDQPLKLFAGLRIMETALAAYFLSSRSTVTWEQCLQHANIACGSDQLMRIAPDVAGPYLLTLHAALAADMENMQQTGTVLDTLTCTLQQVCRFAQLMKPSHVPEEAALLLIVYDCLCLFVRCIQLSRNEAHRRATLQQMQQLLDSLITGGKQQSSLLSAIGLAKKPMFSARLRVVCALMRLYLEQQTVSGTGPSLVVRLGANEPVMNARIQAASQLTNNKLYMPFAEAIQNVQKYFTDVSHHTLDTPRLFATLVRSLYIERYLLALQPNKAKPQSNVF